MKKIKYTQSPFLRLRKVIVCKPVNYRLTEKDILTNEVSSFWMRIGYPPITKDALKQHEQLCDILLENKVQVIHLTPQGHKYEVFTRDIGYSPDREHVIISRMVIQDRKEDPVALIDKVKELGKKIVHLPKECRLEAGNIVSYEPDVIFLGIGLRTNMQTFYELRKLIDADIIPVKIPRNFIHLDVVMNFATKSLAVVYKDAIPQEIIVMLKKKFDVNIININRLQQFTLATNFLVIKEGVIIAARENRDTNRILIKEGTDVIETPYREMHKVGGSIRCSTLPLERV